MSVSRLLRDTCLAASFKRDSEPWKGFREDVASTEKEYCHEFVFKYTKKWGGGVEKERKSTHILLTAHTFGPMKNLYGRQEEIFMFSRPPHTKIAC